MDERRPLLGGGNSHGQHERPPHMHPHPRYSQSRLRQINTFSLIHRIKRDIAALCDSPLSANQLESPKLVFLLSPLQEKYTKLDNLALVFCLLTCRLHFLDTQASPSAYSLANSRAALCEILAVRVIRKRYDQDPESNETILHLAHVLVTSFSPFQGAPQDVLDYHEKVDPRDAIRSYPKSNALELAILSNAKRLVQAMPFQRIIDAIYRGDIVYSPTSFIDLLPDHYHRKPITLHDPDAEPVLNHRRLIVPRIRAMLEYAHFLVLFASYLAVVFTMRRERVNGFEIWLVIYASGFALDKFATVLEHGMGVYVRNLWNTIDLSFCALFAVYLVLRLQDASGSSPFYYAESLNVLACGAIILFPRLAFLVISNNALVLGLRAMFVKFTYLIVLAVWCFSGFLLAFFLLGAGDYSVSTIAKFMVWTTFGMDGAAISESKVFHPWIGPLLWTAYACLSSTLLLATVVSVLAHSFKSIADDETAEVLFKKAVNTLEGIKSDAIFLYQPPFNVPAFIILFPLRFCISARAFHQVNVYAARVLNAPILLTIGIWERRHTLFGHNGMLPLYLLLRRFLNATTPHHDLKMVFDLPPELEDDLQGNGSVPSASLESPGIDEDDRGRSTSPVMRGRNRAADENLRAGSRPSPLTRLYGRGAAGGEEMDTVMRKIDRLEEMINRLDDAIRSSGALS